MRSPGSGTAVWGCVFAVLACGACGGETKQADSPGNCPDGTVLHGSDCIPEAAGGDTSSDSSGGGGTTSKQHKSDDDTASAGGGGGGGAGSADTGSASSSGGGYDHDAVQAELKRAGRQIQKNCGSATDDDGKATGPWGKTTASVVLGRNGHVKQVSVPSPYSGKPVGDCVVHAFEKIQFPPYAGSSDASLDWDVELVQPKHH
ncbi:MAG TPA: hypothetical protein VKU41_29715 [Polyangiaceae bacterium]|nr:hypothetical protein [Polyangiaceae bacterium]